MGAVLHRAQTDAKALKQFQIDFAGWRKNRVHAMQYIKFEDEALTATAGMKRTWRAARSS